MCVQRTVATFPDLKELFGKVKGFGTGAADVFVTQAVLDIVMGRLREVMYTGACRACVPGGTGCIAVVPTVPTVPPPTPCGMVAYFQGSP